MKFKDTKYGDLTGQTYDGDIDVSDLDLTSLEGCPEVVNGTFFCSYNELTSLEGGPKEVNGDFYCTYNDLTSLKGGPKKVNGDFYCTYNDLTSLKNGPKEINGDFYCYDNIIEDYTDLLYINIKGVVFADSSVKVPTEDEYKLFNRVNRDIEKYNKLKKLKDLKI